MIQTKNYQNYHTWIFNTSMLLFCVGLFYSRMLLSVVPVIIFLNAIINKNAVQNFKKLLSNKALLAITGFFFIYLISGINSSNHIHWLDKLKTNLPALVMPLGVAAIAPISKKTFYRFLYFYLIITAISCLIVLANYCFNFNQYTAGYRVGQPLPTPIVYVRYSLMISTAVFCGIYLRLNKYYEKTPFEKYFQYVLIIFLSIFIHILAVRTGILTLYVGFLFTALYFIVKRKKYLLAGVLLISIIATPIVAYKLLPSFNKKINYMLWDWQNHEVASKNGFPSDYIRINSILNGLEIAYEHPLFGVGIGDVPDEMDKKYDKNQPKMPKKYRFPPINQLVLILAGCGILGLVAYLFCLLYPLFYLSNYTNYFFSIFHIVLFTSFIGETSIELQIGKSFYLFFVLLSLGYLSNKTAV